MGSRLPGGFGVFATSSWEMAIQGCLYGEDRPFTERELDREKENFRTFFRKTMKRFRLSQRGKMTRDLSKLNIIAWWYTNNMFVHYRVPRGLEQYGGAAWNAGCLPGAGGIYAGHAKSLPITEMVPGFLRFQSAGEVEYMLHSKEEKTGISYPADPDDEGDHQRKFTKGEAAAHER
ncbi:hypothetical protein [Caldibacillus debilis]|uniref:hypothetical protein n=1 Tax=Caldibacillus debilis TaxID=301148 RepID=UPI000B577702|nr:hypothetical protein [Caldibacillus debilis]OUM91865.1 MAG: hypothetical protein BAA03_08450 [Caldibacillus debilis]